MNDERLGRRVRAAPGADYSEALLEQEALDASHTGMQHDLMRKSLIPYSVFNVSRFLQTTLQSLHEAPCWGGDRRMREKGLFHRHFGRELKIAAAVARGPGIDPLTLCPQGCCTVAFLVFARNAAR